jgi:hypothetical protein
MTIHDKYPPAAQDQEWLQIWCGSVWTAHDVYREIVVTTPTAGAIGKPPPSTGSPSPAGPIQTGAPEPGSQPSSTSGSISGAWIAGVVAGPLVAGIALAGFSAFWWGRRRGRKEAGPKPNPAISEQELQQHVPARSGYQNQQYPPHGEGVDPTTPGSVIRSMMRRMSTAPPVP